MQRLHVPLQQPLLLVDTQHVVTFAVVESADLGRKGVDLGPVAGEGARVWGEEGACEDESGGFVGVGGAVVAVLCFC